jgi:Rrf2 family cysteine metabolism transcriptional repressor
MADEPSRISVGDMIRVIEGPIAPAPCVNDENPEECPLFGDCVFLPLWRKAANALAEVYDGTSFEDLAEMERARRAEEAPSYQI